jgi:hypothetical protein
MLFWVGKLRGTPGVQELPGNPWSGWKESLERLASKILVRSSVMVHFYNPSYLGDRDGEDHNYRLTQAKK